ncbi:uncharacterized protein LOC119376500 [Rhipicephalus sanguineus]|uniref:uncharacterized protein LOC119376500 n=1 Tax=Rhipicephalus sanguineus TaxID=34632 RepID=UPI0018945145|nr:uncharacterized protein LOC119376500 [Rhipicephalus sanguineus]
MPDLGEVHQFRDHAVAGVNWRPTRFVHEVPSYLACGLCRMIPNRILLLPCGHNLCQSCCSAESQDSGKRCPLDQGTFEVEEYVDDDLPATEANTLQVHCWNEAHGCKFEGAIEDMLRHFEKQCTWHAIECSGCGKQVLHKALSNHYVTECSNSNSSAGKGIASAEFSDLTLEDHGATSDDLYNGDLQALFTNPKHDQLLSAIQGEINELTQQFGKHQSSLSEILASQDILKAQMAQVAAPACSTTSDQPRHLDEETTTTSPSASSSLPLRSEKTLILRKLEAFADMSLRTLEHLRQSSTSHGPRGVRVYCEPVRLGCEDWHLTNARSNVRRWSEVSGLVQYHVILENCDADTLTSLLGDAARITVLHMRDAYFTLEVFRDDTDLVLWITFHGILAGSPCPAPVISVRALGTFITHTVVLAPSIQARPCNQHGDSLVHFHREFRKDFEFMKNSFIEGGKMRFLIEFSHKEIVRATRAST